MKDKSKKNPVLTSPWKIGMLVALLLVVVGFGTAYFMVRIYGVELSWLEGNLLKWEVDSYAFFKEMYPLAAGVLLLSIVSYFLIASAVRRYRYFLNSGQDYRRLVQLADSIDDLTNPSQIARLKNYPELQKVLRNYGDQIREISSQLNEQQTQGDQRSVDLEMEIDTLLQGEESQDSLVEDRWWTPLYRKIESYIQESRRNTAGMNKKIHDGKTALGRVALSTGRIVEQIGGTAEEYPEILRAVSELNDLATSLEQTGKDEKGNAPAADKGHVKAIVKEMENMLHKLEDGGKVLNEFSEENNGLALNIALMAAKGEASEHDLAQFAEKVRSTADRFNRLSATFTSMAQGLLGNCYSLKEKLDVGAGSVSGETGEFRSSVTGIATALEERCARLQERICCIGNEVHDVQNLVNQSIKSISEDESSEDVPDSARERAVDEEEDEMTLERSGESMEDSEDSELVIDHGRLWGDDAGSAGRSSYIDDSKTENFPLDSDENTGVEKQEAESSPEEEAAEAVEEPEEFEETGSVEDGAAEIPAVEPESEAGEKEYVIPSIDESSVESGLFVEPETTPDPAAEAAGEPVSEQENESGGAAEHKWFKIDIEKEEEAADAASEEVEVRETDDIASEETEEADEAAPERMEAGEPDAFSVNGLDEPAEVEHSEQEEPFEEEASEMETEDGEPVYDLYDLGAVEYVEETATR